MTTDFGGELLAAALAGTDAGEHPIRHIAALPARPGRTRPWPDWADPDVVRAYADRGVTGLWTHQSDAAELAHRGRHVVIATGTASGKSLAYQLPILDALARDSRARALYLAPTKALSHDQLRSAHARGLPGLALLRRARRVLAASGVLRGDEGRGLRDRDRLQGRGPVRSRALPPLCGGRRG